MLQKYWLFTEMNKKKSVDVTENDIDVYLWIYTLKYLASCGYIDTVTSKRKNMFFILSFKY